MLQIFILSHCLGCEEASRLFQEVRRTLPNLRTELIDLDQQSAALPVDIMAVPAYILDGEVLFFGNPTPEELFATLGAFRPRVAKEDE